VPQADRRVDSPGYGDVSGPGASAKILICVSNEQLKGEETVGSYPAKGERFALVDEYGLVRILTAEEVALTKVLNPKVFQTRAFGLQHEQLTPESRRCRWKPPEAEGVEMQVKVRMADNCRSQPGVDRSRHGL
jgi:hypothetical protein